MIKMKTNVKPGKTPAEISVSMIDQDLKDGISKPEMAIKYGIKPWEVDEMFKNPALKGRRPSRKKTLSFNFVDDMTSVVDVLFPKTETKVDPNQVTLEQAIDEATESVEAVKDQMQETQEAILDMLSPTEFETPEETLIKVNDFQTNGLDNDSLNDDEDDDYISDEETKEVEIDEDDDTFEL